MKITQTQVTVSSVVEIWDSDTSVNFEERDRICYLKRNAI